MNKGRNGFTLLELLLSLVILAVGFLGVGAMQITSIRGNSFSSHLTQATVLGQNKLEYLKCLPYEDPRLQIGQFSEETTRSGMTFHVEYRVSSLGNSMKQITAMVQWTEGIRHGVVLSTIKSR